MGYQKLSQEEIFNEVKQYRKRGFNWEFKGIYGEEISIHTPDYNSYSESDIQKIVENKEKIEFGNRKQIKKLEILDLYYLLNNSNDFRIAADFFD